MIAAMIREARVLRFRAYRYRANPKIIFIFDTITLSLVFPLTMANRLIDGLDFAFRTGARMNLITVCVFIIERVIRTICFAMRVWFITIFIMGFDDIYYTYCRRD